MTQTLRVNALDEAFLNLDQQAVMSVQLEVRVEGRIDAERLAVALRDTAALHPLLRARLDRDRATATSRQWEVADQPDHLALEVTDEPVEVCRARLQSCLPDLSTSPGILFALVHADAGDVLMLNLHHGAFDGMSAIRLITSIARAYTDLDDPSGGPAIEEARDLRKIAASRGLVDVGVRAAKIMGDTIGRTNVTRLAPADGDAVGPHYAFSTLRLTAEQAGTVIGRKPPGCTVNDLAIAAHILTLLRWNRSHDTEVGTAVSVMMPVNMRPAEWSTEVVSNFASYLAIVMRTSDATNLVETTKRVNAHTAPAKENGVAGWLVDVLEPLNVLPRLARKNLQRLMPFVDRQFVETSVLSNLGRVAFPGFGEAGAVTEVWFSPPNFSQTMPLVMGVAGLGRELHICVRSVRSKIGQQALDGYAAMFRDTLMGR